MVLPFQARQLSLPQSSSSSSPQITSILFDSTSSSLALLYSDSSISLYPSSFSLSSLSFPQTFISAPTSSAAFLPLHTPTRRLLFLLSSPSHGGSSVLLRFYILRNNNCFVRAHVSCNHRLLNFDTSKSGVVFNVNHGASLNLTASINVFAMYSVSNRMVWVFAVKMIGEDFDNSVNVKLMKTAVIHCSLPIFTLNVSFGFLILGEYNGVRVFLLQPLVKGKFKKRGSSSSSRLSYGKIQVINGGDDFSSNSSSSSRRNVQLSYNGNLDEKIDKHSDSTKLRSAKLRQDSKEGSACFVSFKGDGDSCNSTEPQLKPVKAITIEALSPNEFLIMDSVGRVHHLRLSNSVLGSEVSCNMQHLSLSIKVQKMAVLPDPSPRAQTLWISDGLHTVHRILLSDPDTSINGSDGKDDDRKLIQISVTPAIFSSEMIQQLVPSAAGALLILGQGSIFAYAIS